MQQKQWADHDGQANGCSRRAVTRRRGTLTDERNHLSVHGLHYAGLNGQAAFFTQPLVVGGRRNLVPSRRAGRDNCLPVHEHGILDPQRNSLALRGFFGREHRRCLEHDQRTSFQRDGGRQRRHDGRRIPRSCTYRDGGGGRYRLRVAACVQAQETQEGEDDFHARKENKELSRNDAVNIAPNLVTTLLAVA